MYQWWQYLYLYLHVQQFVQRQYLQVLLVLLVRFLRVSDAIRQRRRLIDHGSLVDVGRSLLHFRAERLRDDPKSTF